MSKETKALLRAMLFEAETTVSIHRMRRVLRAMCDKDDIDSVMQEIAEMEKDDRQNKEA